MRAKGMKALQEIELQELQLKQKREALELNMMINEADAELKVCQGMQETGVIEDLDSIEKQNNGENAGKEKVVHRSNLNASADEWVPEANTQLHTVNNNKQDVIERNQLQMMEILQLPKVEVVAFDGDPLKYWTFIRSFENTVERALVDSASRLMRLIHYCTVKVQYCTGKARQVIQCCCAMEPNEGYIRAKRLLKERFGNEYLITESWVRKVTAGNSFKAADCERLFEHSAELNNCVVTLKAMGKLNEINSQTNLLKITERLPVYLQNRWRKEARDIRLRRQAAPSIED
jgi:hypothetical protein